MTVASKESLSVSHSECSTNGPQVSSTCPANRRQYTLDILIQVTFFCILSTRFIDVLPFFLYNKFQNINGTVINIPHLN